MASLCKVMHPKCYKHLKEAALAQPADNGHPERASFFENLKLLGLGRQIGRKILRVFRVFLAKLQHPFRHCECLEYLGYMTLVMHISELKLKCVRRVQFSHNNKFVLPIFL